MEPGLQPELALEAGQRAERSREGLLYGVLRGVVVAETAPGAAVERRVGDACDLGERAFVASLMRLHEEAGIDIGHRHRSAFLAVVLRILSCPHTCAKHPYPGRPGPTPSGPTINPSILGLALALWG